MTAMLDMARQASVQRASRFAAASDAALIRLLGVANPALCRRIVATPRVARRLDHRLDEAIAAQAATQAVMAELDLASLPEMPLQVEEQHVPTKDVDGADLSAAISAAITLSASGALIDAADLSHIRSRFGDHAVEFGLLHRRKVPAWMQGIAGKREDVIRQLAATCLAAWATGPYLAFAQSAASDDPIDIGDEGTRKSAASLAEAAFTFLDQRRGVAPDMAGQTL